VSLTTDTDASAMSTTAATWDAAWIWHPGDRWAVDVHLLARKEFDLPGDIARATLRIAAHTDYKLFVNGTYVARGPLPGDPHRYASYDSHDVTLLLREGRNVIAIVCHNYGVGLHWHHRAPGALIAQLDVDTASGRVSVGTDGTWRIARAPGYGRNSPRMFWASGFMETYDVRVADDRWLAAGFDDGEWQRPAVLADSLTRPRVALVPRDIPLLREADERPVGVERGTFTLANVHAVRFDPVLTPGQSGLVYAYTHVRSDEEREVVLQLECDDACEVFVNGRLAIEQNYSEQYARTRVWRGKDDYEQLHDGMGDTGFTATVTLHPGPNSLLVVVDHGPRGWGFVLTALDSASRRPPGLAFASESDGRDGGHDEGRWTVVGPFPSSGMNDSLDNVAADPTALALLAAGSTTARSFLRDPFDYTGVTDYATLMAREERRPGGAVAPGKPIALRAGEYCIVDLGLVRVGYPTLTLRSSGEGVVDVGYGQTLAADRVIRYSNGGRMKYVDRVLLRDGEQIWQPLQRRTGRYIHLSCRAGQGVTIAEVVMRTVGYPVDDAATFECADPMLNRIWEVSRYTTRLLMQYGYQDCLKREEGTLNFNSFNYAARAAAQCFGDRALAQRALRVALGTQNESGWFQGQGISGLNSDEPTEMLWAAVFLRDQYLYAGDDGFLRQSFEPIEEALRYHAKAINQHGLLDGGNWPVFRQGQGVYLDDAQLSSPYLAFFPGELAGDNILYAAALGSAAALAAALGLEERAAFYARKAARVRRALNRRLWDPRARRYADWRRGDEIAATGHPIFTIAALYFELPDGGPDEEQAGDLLRHLLDEVGLPDEDNAAYPLGTFGFYYYFLEVLFRYGRDDLAYELLRRYYGRWLELGATTFGEYFALSDYKGKEALDQEYEVHGYGTSAHLHFYSNILGLRPAAPGFARVVVAPHPGDLPWARGEVATPRGLIRVAWRAQGDTFALEVEAPEGVGCEVRALAGEARHDLRVNGERQDPRSNRVQYQEMLSPTVRRKGGALP